MSADTSPPVMPGTRNATLPDMVSILRTQRARRLDVVAPAAAIHAHDGNLVIDSTVSHLAADGVTSAAGTYRPTAAQLPAKEYRRGRLATAERAIAAKSKEVDDLLAVIGDPETVCDESGWLPAERREMAQSQFRSERISQVKTLRAQIADAKTTLKTLKGRDERAKVRESMRRDQAHLAHWEQMAPLQADGMCSECGKPAWHSQGWTANLDGGFHVTGGPCPAWPRWAKGTQAVREAMRQALQSPPKQPPPPPPKPIAVLAPGVPIEQVITQLTTIQADHPNAQVRQGKGHRWEIWPAPKPPEPAGPAPS